MLTGQLVELPTLVAALRTGSSDAKEKAAASVINLSVSSDNRAAIGKEPGALTALVALLREGSVDGKDRAAVRSVQQAQEHVDWTSEAHRQSRTRHGEQTKAELWLAENRDALDSSNEHADRHGLPLAALRPF